MSHSDISQQDVDDFQLVIDALVQLELNWQAIFLWQDGPLVQAMKNGDLFLVDEISLADDSVLERLNSVLEPERTLVGFPLCSFKIVNYVLIEVIESCYNCNCVSVDYNPPVF